MILITIVKRPIPFFIKPLNYNINFLLPFPETASGTTSTIKQSFQLQRKLFAVKESLISERGSNSWKLPSLEIL